MKKATEHVVLYVRIPVELRARLDAKRLADADDKAWHMVTQQQAVIAALDEWCGNPLIAEPPKNGKAKRVRK